MRDEIERIVKAAYEARVRNDVEAILDHFAEDAEFSLAGAPLAGGVATSVSGLPAIRQAMTGLVGSFVFHAATIVAMLVDGDRAAVQLRVRVSATSGAEEHETELVDLIRVASGKIVQYRQFADTALAARLLAG